MLLVTADFDVRLARNSLIMQHNVPKLILLPLLQHPNRESHLRLEPSTQLRPRSPPRR
jgi:hypothetical protein